MEDLSPYELIDIQQPGASNINDLPDEIIIKILQYVSAEDLVMCYRNVCSRWRHLITNTTALWTGNDIFKGLGWGRTKRSLCHVLVLCPKLKYLAIQGCVGSKRYREKLLKIILQNNQHLEVLYLLDPNFTTDQLRQLFSLQHLKRIIITIYKLEGREERLSNLRSVLDSDIPLISDIKFVNRIEMCWEKVGDSFQIAWTR